MEIEIDDGNISERILMNLFQIKNGHFHFFQSTTYTECRNILLFSQFSELYHLLCILEFHIRGRSHSRCKLKTYVTYTKVYMIEVYCSLIMKILRRASIDPKTARLKSLTSCRQNKCNLELELS